MVVNRYGRGGGGGSDGGSSSIRQRGRELDSKRKSRRKMGARGMEKTHQLTYLHVDLTHWMRTKGTLSYLLKI